MANIEFNKDIYVKARRLIAMAQRGGAPVAMASPPTITFGAAGGSTVITNSELTPGDSPIFNVLGTYPQVWPIGPGFGQDPSNYIYAAAVTNAADGRVPGSKQGGVLKAPWMTDADAFEFLMRGWNIPSYGYRIWIDGQPTALVARLDDDGAGYHYIKVDMGSAKSDGRLIMVEMDRAVSFGGVRVGPNYSVWQAPNEPFRLMVNCDSYGENGGAGINGFANQMGYRLGVPDTWVNGEGGIGYNRVGNNSGLKPRQKLASDCIAYNPDWIVCAMGINDPAGGTAAACQAETSAYLAQLLAGLPNSPVTVIGPWRAPTLNTGSTYYAAIQAACTAQPEYGKRLLYIDTLAESWQDIAGKTTAPSGTGNSNLYIGGDGIHPVQDGHYYLARRAADAVLRHARLLAA